MPMRGSTASARSAGRSSRAASKPARCREGAPYDLAFAKILAKLLRLMAPSLAAVIGSRGEAFVSGLLLAEVPGVLASWRAQGFTLAERIDLEGWASLRLRR
jgi:ribosomal protein L11 methyltransferase